MSITPPLMEMLSDALLQERYVLHIEKLIELMEKEKVRTRNDHDFYPLALMYERKFRHAREIFVDRYHKNILTAFRELQSQGFLEILTCCATHGFLPLMDYCREAVRAQILVAVNNYRKHMGTSPRGIWLAECGYNPGDDRILKDAGIRFFFVDSHGLVLANPRPKYALYSPVYCPSGVAVFARDPESSKQVWSSKEGYPGDFDYREFYRDVGYDLDFEYIAPYIHESGIRINTGVKYHRITGTTDQKKPYNEAAALQKTKAHARHFVSCRIEQSTHLGEVMDRPPIITCPYDAELYGHWWYEGPEFLKSVYEELAATKNVVMPTTPMEYLERYPDNPVATPSFSSWGHKGYAEYWLEECNDWIYRHLHKASERMTELATSFHDTTDPILVRALSQAARELLLAQSSDWAFILKTGTHVEYAALRTREHILNFTMLYEAIKKHEVPVRFLTSLEGKNSIFSEIDFRVYRVTGERVTPTVLEVMMREIRRFGKSSAPEETEPEKSETADEPLETAKKETALDEATTLTGRGEREEETQKVGIPATAVKEIPEKAPLDRKIPEKASPEKKIPVKATLDRKRPGKASPEKKIPEKAPPDPKVLEEMKPLEINDNGDMSEATGRAEASGEATLPTEPVKMKAEAPVPDALKVKAPRTRKQNNRKAPEKSAD